MKISTFAAALAASTIAGSAFAADLPARKAAPAYIAPAPIMTWAGFYIGLNAGATFGGNNTANIVSTSLLPGNAAAAALAALGTGAFGNNNNGTNVAFIGGGQIGWNWQSGGFVAGLEADIQGIAGRRNQQNNVTLGAVGGATILQTVPTGGQLQWLGTVRGRVGFAVSPSWLLYATGGLAYGGVNSNNNNGFSQVSIAGPALAGFGVSDNRGGNVRLGWTVGGGAEWMISQNWSVKAEYLYFDLGNRTSNGVAIDAVTGLTYLGYQTSQRTNGHIARVGLNYHFNWGAAPVVARY